MGIPVHLAMPYCRGSALCSGCDPHVSSLEAHAIPTLNGSLAVAPNGPLFL